MNDVSSKQLKGRSPMRVRKALYPTHREVLLARLLLLVADNIGRFDQSQEYLDLYNEVKLIAEPILRAQQLEELRNATEKTTA